MPDTAVPADATSRAAAYRAAREVPREGLEAWRAAIARAAGPIALAPGRTVLDVGAGTGGFAAALHDWFGVRVVAVEPDDAMRKLIPAQPGIEPLAGTAEHLPVPDACADAAWLGSVLHHLTDLPAAARELRRALRPGGRVLIRNAFPGRFDRDLRARYFPQTARSVARYATVERVVATFAEAGFTRVSLESVPQTTAPTVAAWAATLDRTTDSKLAALTDAEYAEGLARIRADGAAPAVSYLDLLVLSLHAESKSHSPQGREELRENHLRR